jgi:hypothetical protein
MKKYFVFRHDKPQQTPYPYGSPEATACEIVRVGSAEHLPMGFYSAIEADTPEMTYQCLKMPAVCSVELDQARIDLWHNELSPVVDHLSDLSDAIESARNSIADTLDSLITAADECEALKDHDFGENINLEHAFSYIGNPPLLQGPEK